MNLEDRIRKYLDATPPCIAGQNGDTHLFKVACTLYQGFGLSEDETLKFLRYFNEKCEPPWDDSRLLYKTAAAVNARHEKPRGHMLGPRVVPVTPLSKPKYPPKGQATDATRVANITRVHEIKNTPLPTPPKPDFLTRVIYEKHVASVAADQRVTKDRCQATHATAVSYILPAPRDTRHIDLWMTQLHDEIAHWQHYGQLWQKGKMSLPRVDDQPTIWDENDPEFKSALATYQAWMAINPGTPRGQKRRISSTK